MNKDRKIAQITVAASDESYDILYALCNDSTVWYMALKHLDNKWVQLPLIPQGDSNE